MKLQMKNTENCIFIGIDTSNYTTSASVCDCYGEIIANLKIPLAVPVGGRGLRQSDAVFAHVKNLPLISDRLKIYTKDKIVSAVGYSACPRDSKESYMPCFLSGKAAASFLASLLHVPLYSFSHQSGHIMAALYSSGSLDLLNSEKFAVFHVSGGTTEIVIVTPNAGNESIFSTTLMGGTKDLNAGQAIDRIGVKLGLCFPCGADMEKLARMNEKKLPDIKTSVLGLECNLSGLENRAKEIFSESGDAKYTSAYVIDFIGETIVRLSENLRLLYPNIPAVYSGGVMSCSIIREKIEDKFDGAYFAKPEFSSDNAAGIALMCRYLYEQEDRK